MANPEHVKIVKLGWEAVERMGEEYPMDGFDLRGANLEGINLESVNLANANLEEAMLSFAQLGGAQLYRANLRKAGLFSTELVGTNLDGASLREAQFWHANMTGTSVNGTDFARSMFYETILNDLDLSVARGLELVVHEGPSVIDERTLRSSWPLPEAFLRGVGMSEEWIDFARATYGQAIEFYSCFISYSSKDDEFARRLHADLQDNGVRCWFAPDDLRIGDKFRARIDEAIRLHDKLLLILSEDSVNSPWVDNEVESALEKERKAKERGEERTVLFPIRLDSAVEETDAAWAASIRRTRHIGDFSAWKDHDAYQVAFERLLRDLKSGAKEDGNGES